MKKCIILVTVCLFYCHTGVANSQQSLVMSFAKFKQVTGTLHYQVLDCSDTSLEWDELPSVVTDELAITDQLHEQIVELNSGTYCVRFFQDLNSNEKLDLAASSIPKEPVGFSNNPNLMFGQPSPSDSAFSLTTDLHLNIKVNNKKRR